MFDDIQKTPGQTPANLPVGEPEDMFGDTEAAPAGSPVAPTGMASTADEPSAPPVVSSSALGAGVLRPKTLVPPPGTVPSSMPAQDPSAYRIKEPSIGKGIAITIISAVTVALVGGGGWYIYDRFVRQPEPSFPVTNSQPVTAPVATDTVSDTTPLPTAPATTQGNTDVGSEIVDEKVLFGDPIDSDTDGLDDDKETELGTNPNSWDTDGDALSDRDEVIIWKTNALVADTDGDTYGDGLEVKSGYNPLGPGKLFQPPTGASTTAQ